MSIASAITNLTNTIRALATTKGQIKNAVNADIDFIANEQIEQYPNLIRNAINQYKSYIPVVTGEGKLLSLNTVPIKMKEFAVIGDTYQKSYEGKNLFYNSSNSFLGQLDDSRMKITSAQGTRISYIPCKPNTTYTVSRRSPMSIRFHVATTENVPEVGATILSMEKVNNSTTTSITITTPANANYIVIRFIYDQIDYYETYAKTIQIEEGPIATDYEPYVGGTASPNPDYPQTIQVVTGSQTINIGNTTKTVNLGNIELCGIGEYQDVIFKNTIDSEFYNAELDVDSWYKKNAITKVTLNGTESWNYYSGIFISTTVGDYAISNNIPFSDKYIGITNGGSSRLTNYQACFNNATAQNRLYIRDDRYSTVADLKAYLQETNVILYYALRTPTYTKITDETLINQLEAIENTNMNNGTTVIYATQETGLQPYLYINAYKKEGVS